MKEVVRPPKNTRTSMKEAVTLPRNNMADSAALMKSDVSGLKC